MSCRFNIFLNWWHSTEKFSTLKNTVSLQFDHYWLKICTLHCNRHLCHCVNGKWVSLCCCRLYPLMWTEPQQQMVLAEQSPHGSNVKATDDANGWVMCFDEATFSIWSLIQMSASTGTITKRIKRVNSDWFRWESNGTYCNQTASTGGQWSKWLGCLVQLGRHAANGPSNWDS